MLGLALQFAVLACNNFMHPLGFLHGSFVCNTWFMQSLALC